MTEIEMTTQASAMWLAWMRRDPKRCLGLVGAKVRATWTPCPNARRTPVDVLAYLLSYGAVALGAIVTAIQHRRRWRRLALPYALGISLTFVVSVYFGAGRFRFPLDALLIVMSAPAILQALALASRCLPRRAAARVTD
jgi:hypothetical protein